MESRSVFIKPDAPVEKTASGIFLPESMQEANTENVGTVITAAPGTEEEPVCYRKGDRVKYDKNAGRDLDIDGEHVKMVADTDIYCTIIDIPPSSGGL